MHCNWVCKHSDFKYENKQRFGKYFLNIPIKDNFTVAGGKSPIHDFYFKTKYISKQTKLLNHIKIKKSIRDIMRISKSVRHLWGKKTLHNYDCFWLFYVD